VDEFKDIVMKDQGSAADNGKLKGGIMNGSSAGEMLKTQYERREA
jgi:hypothetical protein